MFRTSLYLDFIACEAARFAELNLSTNISIRLMVSGLAGRRSVFACVRGMRCVVYLAKWNRLSHSDSRTVVELRAKCRRTITKPAELAANRAKLRLDLDGLPLELVPAHRVTANTQGGCFAEQQILKWRDLASSQRTEIMTPGRFFFIWIGVTKASRAPASMSFVIV